MPMMQTIRQVLANLREGRPPDAVRIDENAVPSDAFRRRLQALAASEHYLDGLAADVPADLHATLAQSVAHVEAPVTDLPTLAARVSTSLSSLRFGLDRGGLPITPAQRDEIDRLTRLEAVLAALTAAGAGGAAPPRAAPPSPPAG